MAEDDGFRRRTGRTAGMPLGTARISALQELVNLKKNGGKRTDKFEVRLEEKVYDTLSEADYDLHVAKRREESAQFVVDDEGLGYLDGGDDEDYDSGKSDDDNGKDTKPKKVEDAKKKERPSKRVTELAAAAALTGKRRVTSMFAEAPMTAFGRRPREQQNGSLRTGASNRIGASTDSILDDVLAGITADDVDREREKRRRRVLRTRDNPGDLDGQQSRGLSVLPGDVAVLRSHNFASPAAEAPLPVQYQIKESPGALVNETSDSISVDVMPEISLPAKADFRRKTKNRVDSTDLSVSADHLMATDENPDLNTGLQVRHTESSEADDVATVAANSKPVGSQANQVHHEERLQDTNDESFEPVGHALPFHADERHSLDMVDAFGGELRPVKTEIIEPSKDLFITDSTSISATANPEVKFGLQAKIAERSKTGEEATAAWHSILERGAAMKTSNVVKLEELNDENIESDGNTLPVDADGNLPFYLVDAYEEEFGPNPGTVYLFGKVQTGSKGNYTSCCVVVRNLQRCLYAVPAPSVFSDNSLTELEELAKTDGDDAKRALQCKLQELAYDLKVELADSLMAQNVSRFTMVPVKRSYSFDRADVPVGEHYFMKLSYPFKDIPLPHDLQGKFFTCLFGTHTSALELFLIKRRIKGPCWLSISSPVRCPSSSQVSWCKIEINLESPKDLIVAPAMGPVEIPQLVVAAVNLKTVISQKDNVNEIASASVLYCNHVKVDVPMPLAEWNTYKMLNHFSIVRKLEGGVFPVGFTSEVAQVNTKMGANVLSHETSERALLNLLMVKLHQLDPDVLVGHNISGFDLDVLLHRLQACKVQSKMWSKIGRLRRSQMPRLTGGGNTFGSGAGLGHMACIAGRLLCDTYILSRDLLRETSYSLSELARTRLGQERKELVPSEIPAMYQSSETLIELVEAGESDAWLSLGLMFHLSVLPLTRQLTNISGNLWNRTLQGNRAQRVEYLLLHEFHSRKFIVPDKLSLRDKERFINKRRPTSYSTSVSEMDDMPIEEVRDPEDGLGTNSGKKKKGAAYMGGLVLEPKKGLYDKHVLLLDFNSLYPSIIQEYNVCFTTVVKPLDGSIPRLPSTDSPGVLPQVLKGLVERRKQVKGWLKRTTDSLKYQQLDIQQQALKLTANSIYGCLGFTNARFYAKPIAELITSQGREILQSTVDLVQNNLNLEVIYGDTDSIMIHTGIEDLAIAKAVGVKVIKEVNKKYRLLEIDMDGIYKRMLLLKKKKYAAVKIEVNSDGSTREVIEQKGLDIVRRDWSLLSKDIGNFVLKQILSEGSREDVVDAIHTELRKLQEDLRNGQIDLDKFIINKTLTKSPEDYPDAKSQPHVQVAMRMRKSGNRVGCSPGDTVPYVICLEQGTTGPSFSSIAERARHPDELKMESNTWTVDIEYYISQQIRPVVTRLCAPIEGTDAAHLADCLGLDPSKFHQAQPSDQPEDALLSSVSTLDDDDRYRHCEGLELVCPQCTNRYQFPGISQMLDSQPADAGKSEAETSSTVDDALRCSDCKRGGSLQRLSSAMLANQVKQRADEFVTRYYDGVMLCDEDSCGLTTRNVNLRVVGDAERGSVCPNYPRCNGRLGRQYTEVDLYKQLTHFYRLLDVSRALGKIVEVRERMAAEVKLATVRPTFDIAAQAIKDIRDRSGFRWVQLSTLCISVS